jgi:hypothetical protein
MCNEETTRNFLKKAAELSAFAELSAKDHDLSTRRQDQESA